MSLMDKLTSGLERVAEGADKAIDKGKAKVGEMQIELQMDALAKKLGYLVFDFYRGRQVDQALRQRMLDELSELEDKLIQTRAEAAARGGTGAPYGAPSPAGAASSDPPTAAPSSAGAPPAGQSPADTAPGLGSEAGPAPAPAEPGA